MKKKIKKLKKQLNDFRTMYKTLATQYDDLDYKLSDLKYISDTGMKYYSLFAPIKGLEDTCKCNEEPKTEQKLTQKIKGRTTHVKLLEEVSEPNNNDYYQQAKKLLLDYANKTMVKKGNEYTPTGDRFGNFRPILNQQKTSIEKLLGYCEKHVQYMYMQKENPTCNDINELLEHFGDVFNYNILGMAMQNTDIPNSVVGYADRQTQENKIIEIINSFIENDDYPPRGYEELLFCTSLVNLATVTNELAIHLDRLDNDKSNFKENKSCKFYKDNK